MSSLTPDQIRTRERIESVIGVVAPFLNLMLAAGELLSKVVEPEDIEYHPPRTRAGTDPSGAPNGHASAPPL